MATLTATRVHQHRRLRAPFRTPGRALGTAAIHPGSDRLPAAPIAVMIAFSFNRVDQTLGDGKFNFEWHAFSLNAWSHPFDWPGLPASIVTSLSVAILSTIGATTLGHTHRPGPDALSVPWPGSHQLPDLPAHGDARSGHGRQPADRLHRDGYGLALPRGRADRDLLSPRLHHHPHRAHHVQHQLRRRHREGASGLASTGGSRKRPWTWARTNGRRSGRSPSP